MSRRPPSSPLFPYTTLFRSGRSLPRDVRASRPWLAGTVRTVLDEERLPPLRHSAEGAGRSRNPPVRARHRDGTPLDRKSTRLNSSHVVISYAVFCLK